MAVLPFQFVVDPPLSSYVMEKLGTDEKAALKKNALSVLNNIHSQGVYHGDISVDNLLCKREGMKVMILDFQLARFDDDDGPGDRKAWKYDDIAMLWRIFDIFGVEDDRPKASLGVSWGFFGKGDKNIVSWLQEIEMAIEMARAPKTLNRPTCRGGNRSKSFGPTPQIGSVRRILTADRFGSMLEVFSSEGSIRFDNLKTSARFDR